MKHTAMCPVEAAVGRQGTLPPLSSQDVADWLMMTNVSQIFVAEEVSSKPHGFHGLFISGFRQELIQLLSG